MHAGAYVKVRDNLPRTCDLSARTSRRFFLLRSRAWTVRGRLAFGFLDLIAACVVTLGVFRGLPARFWAIDGGAAAAVIALLVASGAGLMLNRSWAPRVARAASIVVLAIGLALVATLALTASYLAGIYGPVGRGGAVILVLVAALGLPYLVVLPASQLLWLGRR